jgi:DNA-directed RNA polymerase specialized sigma24 family protein
MIVYISERLNQWADWVASGRRIHRLGYPSQVGFYRLSRSAGLRGPNENEHAWEIERLVHRLDPIFRQTVEQFYLHPGTVDSHALALGCCRDTLYTRIHAVHVRIMDWLQMA